MSGLLSQGYEVFDINLKSTWNVEEAYDRNGHQNTKRCPVIWVLRNLLIKGNFQNGLSEVKRGCSVFSELSRRYH